MKTQSLTSFPLIRIVIVKLTSILRCPDTAPTKKKMLNSGTAEYLKKKADGYSVYVQANDIDEWDIDDIAEQVADK